MKKFRLRGLAVRCRITPSAGRASASVGRGCGDYNPHDKQRILLKCNYLIAPKNAVWLSKALLAVNTGVFYVVKAAMEYSKSPKNPLQYAVGYLCNAMRLLNNIHPLVPILLIIALIIAATWGIVQL